MLTLQLLRVHGDDEPLDVGEREQDDGGGHGRPLGGVPQRDYPLRVHHQRLGERILRGSKRVRHSNFWALLSKELNEVFRHVQFIQGDHGGLRPGLR